MSSATCFSSSKPSKQPAEKPTEKRVRFNIENHMSNGAASKRAKKQDMYRKYRIKIRKDIVEYDLNFDEILDSLGEGILAYYQNLDNPENLKIIVQHYERGFWGNEYLIDFYKKFCDSLMEEQDEQVAQCMIEANYENFISNSSGMGPQMEICHIANIYKIFGKRRIYELWTRIDQEFQQRRMR